MCGIREKRMPNNVKSGYPGGCATPRVATVEINSAPSPGKSVRLSVYKYSVRLQIKRKNGIRYFFIESNTHVFITFNANLCYTISS